MRYLVKYIGPPSEMEERVIPSNEALVRRVTVDELGFANCSCGRVIDELPCVHVVACFDACTEEMWHLRWTNVFARCFLVDGCEEETALMAEQLERIRDGKRAWRGIDVRKFMVGEEKSEDYLIYLFRSDREMFEGKLNKGGEEAEDSRWETSDTPYDNVEMYVSPAKKKIDEVMAVKRTEIDTEDSNYTHLMKMCQDIHKATGSNSAKLKMQNEWMAELLSKLQEGGDNDSRLEQEEGLSFGGGERRDWGRR